MNPAGVQRAMPFAGVWGVPTKRPFPFDACGVELNKNMVPLSPICVHYVYLFRSSIMYAMSMLKGALIL
jgi:hypothetical protein